MAKTFDLDDPAGYLGYLTESTVQMILYGNLTQTFGMGKTITVHDGAEPLPDTQQPGFALVMDDGRMLPVPAPGGGL